MHRNNRKRFVYNYKNINIHKYKNCLSWCNLYKMYGYIRHYLKKHHIEYNNLIIQPYYKTYYVEISNPYYEDGYIYIETSSTSKWLHTLKLICEENDIHFCETYDEYIQYNHEYNNRNIPKEPKVIFELLTDPKYDLYDMNGDWIGHTKYTLENVIDLCKRNNCTFKRL